MGHSIGQVSLSPSLCSFVLKLGYEVSVRGKQVYEIGEASQDFKYNKEYLFEIIFDSVTIHTVIMLVPYVLMVADFAVIQNIHEFQIFV